MKQNNMIVYIFLLIQIKNREILINYGIKKIKKTKTYIIDQRMHRYIITMFFLHENNHLLASVENNNYYYQTL